MRISIDTNVYTAFFRGDERVRAAVQKSQDMSVSAVVVGELIFGFQNGTRFAPNRQLLDTFLSEPLVSLLPVTLATSERFGMIAAELKKAGTPIPQNDIWIAAHAMESGTTLLSFDRHFQHVRGLMYTLL